MAVAVAMDQEGQDERVRDADRGNRASSAAGLDGLDRADRLDGADRLDRAAKAVAADKVAADTVTVDKVSVDKVSVDRVSVDRVSVDRVSVDTVVFDLGNVLVGWDPRAAFEGVVEPAEVEWFFEAANFPAVNRRMDAGVSVQETAETLALQNPRLAELYLHYVERFPASLTGPVPGSAELVGELRDQGIRLLGLTNWSAETFHHALPAAPAIGLLEDVLVSGREGVIKPDPRVFRLLIERYGLDAPRTVFIDDSRENVMAAAGAGLDAVLFTGAEGLRIELCSRGLLGPPQDPAARGLLRS